MIGVDELLARMAATLRQEIGPAVPDAYPRTQAFMAAVVLEKLSGQLRSAAEDARAEQDDLRLLASDLAVQLSEGPCPPELSATAAELAGPEGRTALSRFIEALYTSSERLGPARFEALRARVRQTLRADLDRQVRYAA
ncbi:MAG: hypothetical protein QOJ19_2716 [Acidimicrobiia bacterium]|jgi:hypothetical protein|nr:hypothetical protein [Acidimicrobiia bacterium]